MTPEEKARAKIDAMLAASGWLVQTKDRLITRRSATAVDLAKCISFGEQLPSILDEFNLELVA
jgi:type I site-specific restriction endonuclease